MRQFHTQLCYSRDRNEKPFVFSLYFFLKNKSDLRSSLFYLEKNKGERENLKWIAGIASNKKLI